MNGPGLRMGFVGVSTAGSSILRVFPAWADELGLPTRTLEGQDLPLDATTEQYRAVVARYREDPDLVGALITAHKVGLFRAAADMFDELDPYARRFEEISTIHTRGGRLVGHAKDPITAGLAIGDLLPPDHFARTGGDAICLGAGGAGLAIAYHLRERADAPKRLVVVDSVPERVEHARLLVEQTFGAAGCEFVVATEAAENDALVSAASPGTMVINATGLGKDRPGSPVTDAVRFPDGGVAWEINYRGELTFLQQARAQADRLAVVGDGWRYFVHGWSQVVAEVFDVPMNEARVDRLAHLAAAARD